MLGPGWWSLDRTSHYMITLPWLPGSQRNLAVSFHNIILSLSSYIYTRLEHSHHESQEDLEDVEDAEDYARQIYVFFCWIENKWKNFIRERFWMYLLKWDTRLDSLFSSFHSEILSAVNLPWGFTQKFNKTCIQNEKTPGEGTRNFQMKEWLQQGTIPF